MLSSTKDTLVLIMNFFSLNFTSIEIEEERVSSTKTNAPLEGGGLKTNKGKQGGEGLRTQES